MTRHFILRALYLIPTILAALFIAFSLANLTPGDPITKMLMEFAGTGGTFTEADRQAMIESYGLNRPFLLQFFDYVWNIVRLNFGRTLNNSAEIGAMLARSLPISLQLGCGALVIKIVFGIPLGTLAAIRNGTWIDNLIVGFSVILRAVPVFVWAPLLLVVLVLWLHVTKVPLGWSGLFTGQAIIPMLLLAAPGLSLVIQQTRVGVLDVLTNDYIRTARAKGLSQRVIIIRHALRNALIPVVTSLGVIVGTMITSTLFIDKIFSIPGFGSLYWEGIQSLDFRLLLATIAVVTVSVSLANFLVDVLYAMLDPRIRYKGSRG